MTKTALSLLFFFFLAVTGCAEPQAQDAERTEASAPPCDPDDGGLQLPDGFCAVVVADSLGGARHLVARDNGDLYVALRSADDGGGIAALHDSDGDGRFDVVEKFGAVGGTGIAIHDGYLYFAPDTALMRYALPEEGLVPPGEPERMISGLLEQGAHAAKPITFDGQGNLYMTIGAPSNACQAEDRTPGTPGQDPCPLLEQHGGIWRFDADQPGQTQAADGHRYATGIRNAVALDWNSATQTLYALQHGRDQLSQLWSDLYTDEQSAELPAEEFFRIEDGDNFGWPYCYYDQIQGKKVLAPEYGGDGDEVGRCAEFENPIAAFPGHWAPNDLLFYTGTQFPESYRNGAFIAFHGSWNRAPLPQAGYKIVFVPFSGAEPSGEGQTFADGFAKTGTIEAPGDAQYRPMGLAQAPDGSLYISDSEKGRIWRVSYTGS